MKPTKTALDMSCDVAKRHMIDKIRVVIAAGALGFLAVVSLDAGRVHAQDLTSSQGYTETVAGQSGISAVPASGAAGSGGRSGSYSCSGTSWGAACVGFYSMGNYNLNDATNGYDAPEGGFSTSVTSGDTDVAQVVNYDAATVSDTPFSVSVTQVAGTVDTKVINSETGMTPADWVNGGGAFSVTVTA